MFSGKSNVVRTTNPLLVRVLLTCVTQRLSELLTKYPSQELPVDNYLLKLTLFITYSTCER